MLQQDERFEETRTWGRVLLDLTRQCDSAGYYQWFLSAEQGGDFEKRTDADEVWAALTGVGEAVAESLARRARDAIDHDKSEDCVRLVRVLRLAVPEAHAARRCQINVADRLEDLVVSRSNKLCDELFHGIIWEKRRWNRHVRPNLKRSKSAAKKVKGEIDPLLKAIKTVDEDDGAIERMERVSVPAARMLRNLGLAWRWSNMPAQGAQSLRRALEFARGTPMEQKLRNDLGLKSVGGVGPKKKSSSGWIFLAGLLMGLGRLMTSSPKDSRSTDRLDFQLPRLPKVAPPPEWKYPTTPGVRIEPYLPAPRDVYRPTVPTRRPDPIVVPRIPTHQAPPTPPAPPTQSGRRPLMPAQMLKALEGQNVEPPDSPPANPLAPESIH